ncbi:MAG: polyprenyl synthetase family protein [Candidatus Eiseniibacteriota bacterium]
MTESSRFERYLKRVRPRIDAALDRLLPPSRREPRVLHRAMRYSVFAGGKRIRPALCLLACESVLGRSAPALSAGAALEMIHTFSLIHDDLPGMDDDNLRRGRPTNHRVFGEGMAILAGDALLSLAFETLSGAPLGRARDPRPLLATVCEATGPEGMIGGQALDLLFEGKKVPLHRIYAMHRRKTGALLRGSLRLGAQIGGASRGQLRAFEAYGARIGLAFQIVDDLLNVRSTPRELGKSAGSDRKRKKATAAARAGTMAAERDAATLLDEAARMSGRLGARAAEFESLTHYLLHRTH